MRMRDFISIRLLVWGMLCLICILFVFISFVGVKFRHGEALLKLSLQEPRNDRLGVELIAISNQCATIRVLHTSEILTVIKGESITSRGNRLHVRHISGDERAIALVKRVTFNRLHFWTPQSLRVNP